MQKKNKKFEDWFNKSKEFVINSFEAKDAEDSVNPSDRKIFTFSEMQKAFEAGQSVRLPLRAKARSSRRVV